MQERRDVEFDFTLELEEDMQKIIVQFERLRDDALRRNSNTEIRIINRLIVISNENKEQYYYIINGQIQEARVKKVTTLNLEHEGENLPHKLEPNIFQRIKERIRKRLFKNPHGDIVYIRPPLDNSDFKSQTTDFKSYLSNMENFYEIDMADMQEEEKSEEIEESLEEK